MLTYEELTAGVMRRSFAPDLAEEIADAAGRASRRRTSCVTEFRFVLPRGYVDRSGQRPPQRRDAPRHGADELVPLLDDRVRENPAYLTVVLLARVITELGTLTDVHAGVIENLFATDLAFLQDLYRRDQHRGAHAGARSSARPASTRSTVDLAGGRLGES